MSQIIQGNQKHMTAEDRAYIEEALRRNMSFKGSKISFQRPDYHFKGDKETSYHPKTKQL
jgi:hypothetical protein